VRYCRRETSEEGILVLNFSKKVRLPSSSYLAAIEQEMMLQKKLKFKGATEIAQKFRAK